jgi:hypothetical protein
MSNEDMRRMVQNLASSFLVDKAEREILNEYLRTGRAFELGLDGKIYYAEAA